MRSPARTTAGSLSADDQVVLNVRVPRSAFTTIAAPPELISQRTVERETGVGARSYLEDIGSPIYKYEVIRRGKLRITPLKSYVAFLRGRSEEAARAAAEAPNDGASAVLAEVGLRVIGGGAR
jgi:hypothetical protein